MKKAATKKRQKLLVWKYFTPNPDSKRAKLALMRLGQWEEIYHGEVLVAHASHRDNLLAMGFIECEGPKVYPSIRAALRGKNNLRLRFTE